MYKGRVQKKKKIFMENSITGGGVVKAKIACVVDKILRVAAIIARAAAKSGIWEAKICLSESSFIIF